MYLQVSDDASRKIAYRQPGPFIGIIMGSADAGKAMQQLHVLNIVVVDAERVGKPSREGYVKFEHPDVLLAYHRNGLLKQKKSIVRRLLERITIRTSDCGCEEK